MGYIEMFSSKYKQLLSLQNDYIEGTTVAQVTDKDQSKETAKDESKETDKSQAKETDKSQAKESDRPEQFEDASSGPTDEDKDKETKKEENPMENLSPMQSIQVKN